MNISEQEKLIIFRKDLILRIEEVFLCENVI